MPVAKFQLTFRQLVWKRGGALLLLSLTIGCRANQVSSSPQPSATPTAHPVQSASADPNGVRPRPISSQNPSVTQSVGNNRKPIIQQIITNPTSLSSKSDSMGLKVVAFDPDGDPLKLTWLATKGHLSSSDGESVSWQPQNSDSNFVSGAATISVIADDSKGGVDSRSINLQINPNGATILQADQPIEQQQVTVKAVETPSNEINLDIGQLQQLTASAILSDGSKSSEILWLSSNANIVSVSSTGQLHRNLSGDVVIFAKSLLDPLKQQVIRVTESVVPVLNPASSSPSPQALLSPSAQQFAAVPSGLLVSNVTSNGFTVNWTAVSDATNYKVYSNGSLVTTVSNPNYSFTSLNTNTPYSIQVSSVNSSGESARSDLLTVTTGAPIVNLPVSPTGINNSNLSSTGFTVNWQAVNGATSYNVYMNGNYINSVTGTSYDLSNLSPSTMYGVQITSVNSAGESPRSTALNVTTGAPPLAVPNSPSGLSSSNITSGGFTINWPAISGATSYLVYINGNSITRVTSASYNFTNLAANTSYSIQVRAENSAGSSPLSNALAVTTSMPIAIPIAPSGVSSNNITTNSFALSWSPVNGATSYNIYRDNTLVANNIMETSYSSNGLNANTTYIMQVSAVNSGGVSARSNGINVTTSAPIPYAPTGLISSNLTSNSFTLSWPSVIGATSYNVFKDGTLLASNVPGALYNVFGLNSGTTYSMQVSAVNTTGESSKSTVQIVTTPVATIPAAPSGLHSSGISSSGFTLDWGGISGANSYNVYRDNILVANNVSSIYTFTGLNASTTYSIQVSSLNSAGESSKSTGLSVTTNPANVTVTTLAGSTYGYIDGLGTTAKFSSPVSVAVDSSGNIFVAESDGHRIRKITPGGVVSTLAGSGTSGYADGSGTSAQFNSPCGVTVDSNGNVYVADTQNHRIRKITPGGVVSTLAGNGVSGYADGSGTSAQFAAPFGIAVDSNGIVYVADQGNNKIRKITPGGVVSTLAGSGTSGYADGSGASAQFNFPRGVAVDNSNGNIYVADTQNNKIRKITTGGTVSTLAGNGTYGYADGSGTSAQFRNPPSVAVDSNGNIYVAEQNTSRVRKITPVGVVTTYAGNGLVGYSDGTGTSAIFNGLMGVAVDNSGNVYIAEISGNRIRKIAIGP